MTDTIIPFPVRPLHLEPIVTIDRSQFDSYEAFANAVLQVKQLLDEHYAPTSGDNVVPLPTARRHIAE